MQDEPIILGEEAFAAISAVEGLYLSPAYRQRIDSLPGQGLTIDQIRGTLISDLQTRSTS